MIGGNGTNSPILQTGDDGVDVVLRSQRRHHLEIGVELLADERIGERKVVWSRFSGHIDSLGFRAPHQID